MNCPNCGTYSEQIGGFCGTCGTQLVQNSAPNINNNYNNAQQAAVANNIHYNNGIPGNMQQAGVGSLTIVRPNNFVGCLIAYDVYIDGYLMGSVPNGETRTFPLYYGTHLVQIKQGFNKGEIQILVNEHDRNLVFNCPIKMGLVTNSIEFQLMNISS